MYIYASHKSSKNTFEIIQGQREKAIQNVSMPNVEASLNKVEIYGNFV